MLNIHTLFLFCFIFSVLNVIRACFRLIGTLLQSNPEKLVISGRELLILGLTISYVLTYLIQL
jgi:hypothetical protein